MKIPEHEIPIRRELGEALMEFVQKIGESRLEGDEEDAVLRQVATEKFRQAVEKAAHQQIEVSLARHYGFTEEELDFIINYDINTTSATRRRRQLSTFVSWCQKHITGDEKGHSATNFSIREKKSLENFHTFHFANSL